MVTDRWLPKLKEFEDGIRAGVEEWAKKRFEGYKPDKAADFYGVVMEELFIDDAAAQREIEAICGGVDPGFGYAVLATLMADDRYGERCNVVLTTNFDDLLADALYLYTKKKPLVITHEALIGYFKITRIGPTEVKLHGDAHLEPKSFEADTADLDEKVKTVIRNLLCETGLIFVGYGGNDKSIATLFNSLPRRGALPGGIYWVRNTVPDSEIGPWLRDRKAVHVKHTDFDELMLLIMAEFNLPHPRWGRFEELKKSYFDTYKGLQDKISARAETREKKALEKAFDESVAELKDWWAVELEATKYKDSDSKKADEIYLAGIKKFTDSDELLCNYAIFLSEIVKDYDEAEEYYKRALAAEPNDAYYLGNYALFLTNRRKDHDAAEMYFRKALDAAADDANVIGNYAVFLYTIRKDYDAAEAYYERALEADSGHANTICTYAVFLKDIKKDYDKAETYFKRALDFGPHNPAYLGNYANFLYVIRRNYDEAEIFYERALEAEPKHATNLGNYARFLLARGKTSKGFDLLPRALELADEPRLILECRFYYYAHTGNEEERSANLTRIKSLLGDGVRSPGWDLSLNVSRAKEDGHPEPELLETLARVIADEEDAEALEEFTAWREA